MKQLYQKKPETCKLVEARSETVRFLTDYSKSLKIMNYKGLDFESNQN